MQHAYVRVEGIVEETGRHQAEEDEQTDGQVTCPGPIAAPANSAHESNEKWM